MAVDRNNARVASLYNCLTPAVIAAIDSAVKPAKKHKKTISVCGEMTSVPMAIQILLGMGVDSLIMNTSSMRRNQWLFQSFTSAQTQAILAQVLIMEDTQSIRRYLSDMLEQANQDGLNRAGN